MSTTEERLAALQPQRIKRYVEICDRCGARNPFLHRTTVNGVIYAKCKHCGRHAIITLFIPSSNGPR